MTSKLKSVDKLIDQDHRNIKSRTKAVLGFRQFRSAATRISGIELIHRLSRDA
ncbi:DDE-type integrase/transposase/recombinase [Caballeronia sp. LjRoot34]|jgi:transposase-like protein